MSLLRQHFYQDFRYVKKNYFIIVCTVHVRYGIKQELNHPFFCTTYFEDINYNVLMVCRGPINIQMLLSFTLCMFTAIQFVAAVYSRDINVLLHHTETKQVQIMTWLTLVKPWRNLHFNKPKKGNVIHLPVILNLTWGASDYLHWFVVCDIHHKWVLDCL